MMFRSVVLPQPEGPTMQTNSPGADLQVDPLQDVDGLALSLAGIGHPEVADGEASGPVRGGLGR